MKPIPKEDTLTFLTGQLAEGGRPNFLLHFLRQESVNKGTYAADLPDAGPTGAVLRLVGPVSVYCEWAR